MDILSLFSGFLLKGLQRLDCQLLNCLFAAENKAINYFHNKTTFLLFLIALGLKVTTLHIDLLLPTAMWQGLTRTNGDYVLSLYEKLSLLFCVWRSILRSLRLIVFIVGFSLNL